MMKHRHQWLFNIMIRLCFFMSVTAGLTWLRSLIAMDTISWYSPKSPSGSFSFIEIRSLWGEIWLGSETLPRATRARLWLGDGWHFTSSRGQFGVRWWPDYNFIFRELRVVSVSDKYDFIIIPDWLLMFPGLVIVAVRLFSIVTGSRTCRIRQTRWKSGLCQLCGYDLRGSPGKCPECGEVVSPPPERPAIYRKFWLIIESLRQRNGAIIGRLLLLAPVLCIGLIQLWQMFWVLDITISQGYAWPPYEFVVVLIFLIPTSTIVSLLIRSINRLLEQIGQQDVYSVSGDNTELAPGTNLKLEKGRSLVDYE